MTNRIGVFYSSPATSFFLEADHIASDNVNGRWLVRYYLRSVNGPGASSSSQYNGPGVQVGYHNGLEFGRHSGNPFLPAGVPNGAGRWSDGPWDIWINGRNAWNMPLQMLLQYGSINAWSSGSIYLPQLANIPNQPGTPTASEVTTTSMRISWSIPGDGGSPIDQMLLRRYDTADTNSTTYVDYPQGGGATSLVVNGLVPQKTYYWKVYAHNAVGFSPGSGVLSQSTLPSSAPGLTVTPNVSGSSTTAVLSPPGGATGVTKYVLQRRAAGTTAPVTTVESATSPIVTGGLAPGSVWEYRASAWFGDYQSPWTGWQTVAQPNPNTDAGSFYDGNTLDTEVFDYAWSGTPNNSWSAQRGKVPTGWKTFAQASVASGGMGSVFQALGGFRGSYAARAVFFADTTAFNFSMGTADGPSTAALADVEGNATYYGSVYAWPSKKQRMRAVIMWWSATGAFISSSIGEEAVLPAEGYTRLTVRATAPANAQWASIIAQNIVGVDGSLWLGGDWLQLDAAMITLQDLFDYFDGDTADTNTYRYDWLGASNASASMRTTLAEGSGVDPLLDPDCPPIPGAPQPPKIDTSCIDEVGTWRRYWVVIPESEVYDWLAVVPTLTITTGGFAARQVRIRFYPNPDGVPPSTAINLPIESEQIISYMPANTVFTLDGVSQSAWASVAGGNERPADHLLYGADGLPATWPVLSCGDAYLISIDVPLDAPEGNIVTGASLTTRMM